MDKIKSKISFWSNNKSFENVFCVDTAHPQTAFVPYTKNHKETYLLMLIDISGDLTEVSQKIIKFVDDCRENKQKLLLAIIHPDKVDTEKNIYFKKLLEETSIDQANYRLVMVKDLYQANLIRPVTWFDTYLHKIIQNKKIDITVRGDGQYYPLSVQDFISAVIKIFYLSGTAGKTFWVIGETITDLDLAYLVKKKMENIDGEEIEINAERQDAGTDNNIRSLGNQTAVALNWEPVDDFYTSLGKLIMQLSNDKDELHYTLTADNNIRIRKWILDTKRKIKGLTSRYHKETDTANVRNIFDRFFRKPLEWAMLTLAFIYFSVSLIYAGSTYYSLKGSERSISALRRGDIGESVKHHNNAKLFSQISHTSYEIISPMLKLVLEDINFKNHNLITLVSYIDSSIGNIQQTITLTETIYKGLTGSDHGTSVEDITLALSSHLSQIYQNINIIKLLSLPGKLPSVVEQNIVLSEEYKNLDTIELQIQSILKTVDLLPAALAGEHARNIVILYQNNQNLHASGGRIDFVQVLVVEQGKVVSGKLYDAQEIDDLSSEAVQPPPLLSQFLQQDHWKMQDLNYNPDFSQTSLNISWYIERTLKFRPDVIIAVNNILIENYLDQAGGMPLGGDTITADKIKATTGLTKNQYRDLIIPFTDNILGGKESLIGIGRILAKGIAENQILYWSADTAVQKDIVNQNFSGTILDRPCHPAMSGISGCLSQTTYLNETSISLYGIPNRYQRSVRHRVDVEESNTRHEYLLNYELQSGVPEENKPSLKIFQLIVSSPSTIRSVGVDGEIIATPGLTKSTENTFDRYQIPLVFNQDKSREIRIRFDIPTHPITTYPFGYSLTEYRQPGTYDAGVTLELAYPEGLRLSTITAPVETLPGKFLYSYPPRTSTFGVSFLPNQQ